MTACAFLDAEWRGGRAAEGPALEKRYPVKNGIVGSNPTLSAIDSLFSTRSGFCPLLSEIPRVEYAVAFISFFDPPYHGEMTEMAEGARLESVCTVTGTEGSNPSLSAINSTCDFILHLDIYRYLEMALINLRGYQRNCRVSSKESWPGPLR